MSAESEPSDADAAHASSPLAGRIAVVAGATRGAGRGIARALGEAGATVYCTGRSVRGALSDYGRPETIEETAELIHAAGGTAHAVRVDHSSEAEVERFFADLDARHGRLDVLVDSVAGEHPIMRQWCSFWETDLAKAEAVFREGFLTHVITAKHAAPLMMRARRGLIVEVTEADIIGAGGNPLARNAKDGLKLLALTMAAELEPHGVAAISITPGFLRSERMLEHFGVSEDNWREAGKQDRNFLESESPLFVGRVVAALAADPTVLARTGQLFSSWEAAREYGITDVDGRRPDWGALDIDFSMHPPELLELMRTGARIELEWLEALAQRTRRFLGQLPA